MTMFAIFHTAANMSVLPQRLKDARLTAGLSQEKLGISVGLDEMSASTRMNRYELGKRVPDMALVERLGEVLNVPAAYFYAVTEEEAVLLVGFHRLSRSGRAKVLELLADLKK